MRAKSEITKRLSDKLTSDIWKKLKTGLLGRELIALGGEIISESENVKDTLLLQLNPETADISGIYMLAQMNEVPITNIKPSTIVVDMENVRTFAPFELSYNIGNQTFYNIEYTLPNKKGVALVNGTPKNSTNFTPQERPVYDNGISYTCYNIGNAYPDSITVKKSDGTEIQRYSSDVALSDSIDIMYKIITDPDGTQNIRFLLADGVTMPENYTIEWLDHSNGSVDYENEDVKINNNKVATVQYGSEGSVDDVDYMRKQLMAEMAKYDGLNTPKSVERYVNSKPYVVDCKCAFDENGRICVYVKPASGSGLNIYLDFAELAAHIALNSLMFPNIKIVTGKKLMFGIIISGISEEAIQSYARELIQTKYAYDAIGFSSAVNTSEIVADIYGKYGIVPSITMTLSENFVVDEPLSYVPVRNTIKGYNEDGVQTMSENGGVLYSISTLRDLMSLYKVVCCVGNMVLFKKYRQYIQRDVKEAGGVNPYFVSIIDDTDYDNDTQSGHSGSQFRYISPYSQKYSELDDFYLWDASTNTIKPFDEQIRNLLLKTDSSWFDGGVDAWKNLISFGYSPETYNLYNGTTPYDATSNPYNGFLSMQDVQVLSTNNNVIIKFVMSDNGANEYRNFTSGGTEGTLKYNIFDWYGVNDGKIKVSTLEHNAYNKAHYQVAVCVSNSIFRNMLSESWGELKDVFYGMDDSNIVGGLTGFYDGFSGYNYTTNSYDNIKASSFYFENTLYYLREITNNYVLLSNRTNANVITIPLISNFIGMIEQDGVLYVVQKNNIAVVDGFSGIKQKIKNYNIYNGNALFTVNDIVVGLNGTIMIKSTDGFYMTRKIKIRDSVSIVFDNIQKLFVDYTFVDSTGNTVNVADLNIGSCTPDFATCYKNTRNKPANDGNATATSTLDFYCYNINTGESVSYNCACTTKCTYHDRYSYSSGAYIGHGGYEEITTVNSNMSGKMQEIGIMDYKNSKIDINGTADLSSIVTVKYDGVASNNKQDCYIVLDENDIKFI